jgi:hypothetical protein
MGTGSDPYYELPLTAPLLVLIQRKEVWRNIHLAELSQMEERSVMSDSLPLRSFDETTLKMEEERLQRALVKLLARRAMSSTSQLDEEEKHRLPLTPNLPYGVLNENATTVLTMPKDAKNDVGPCWLIELHGLGTHMAPIAIEIAGDVVIGVARPGQEAPDFDLGPYRADEKGVSRRHAVLRPSRNRLYLIDLQSTNGTRVNALPVGAGVARELRTTDTISLGAMTFSVKLLATPADYEKARQMRTSSAH